MDPLRTSFAITGTTAALLSGVSAHTELERREDLGAEQQVDATTLLDIAPVLVGGATLFAGTRMLARDPNVGAALVGSGLGIMMGSIFGEFAGLVSSNAID